MINTLFLDLGGVLLTNGWDSEARNKAAKAFDLDVVELTERHNMIFYIYEQGNLTLDEYLDKVIFYKERHFKHDDFRSFMVAQSQPHSKMMKLFSQLKAKYGLKLVALSNEGRELAEYRIKTYGLNEIIDFFVVSSFVHLRKPDFDFYRMALDITQVPLQHIIYIDDRQMLVEVAGSLGIAGIHHTSYESTREKLASMGLTLA